MIIIKDICRNTKMTLQTHENKEKQSQAILKIDQRFEHFFYIIEVVNVLDNPFFRLHREKKNEKPPIFLKK